MEHGAGAPVSILWPHRVTVRAPGGGTAGEFSDQDVWQDESGETPEVLFDGPANVNDRGRVLQRDESGLPSQVSDATCYLKKKGAAARIPSDAVVTIDWKDGTTSDAVVIGARHADNSLELKRV
jgi:hypothetical protein